MRLGCGCLALLLVLAGAGGMLGWGTYRALDRPDHPSSAATPEDGRRAQEKLYQIGKRSGADASAPRGAPIVLTENEINAFLARHLVEAADVQLSGFGVRLPAPDRAELTGHTRLGSLLGESPLRGLASRVPVSWLDRPVWIRLGGRVLVETADRERRYLRLDVDEFAIGRQELPAVLARMVLDPATLRLLRWRVPPGLRDVRIERGRAVVRTAS